MLWIKLSVCLSLACSACTSYVPGTPGAPWTQEEADIVKEKLNRAWKRPSDGMDAVMDSIFDPNGIVSKTFGFLPSPQKALRLAFHDCLKYEDGTGGCDGCLNLYDQGTNVKTDNNGLQPIAALLELIYKDPSFPPKAQAMELSLFDLGKSRADLWAFAALVAVDYFGQITNDDCQQGTNSKFCEGRLHGNFSQCSADISSLKFQTGRSDCITDEIVGYVTTKHEVHPNPNGNGDQTVAFFQEHFNFTMRVIVAIMGAHTIGKFNNAVSGFLYSWTRETTDILNNEYYRLITARPEYALDSCIGDRHGDPAKSHWEVLSEGKGKPEFNGRLIWFHHYLRCPDCIELPDFDDSKFKSVGGLEGCCTDVKAGKWCNPGCVKSVRKDETAMNSEMGLYYKFDIDPTTLRATGCPGFDSWDFKDLSPDPECPLQDMLTEEGLPLHSIVDEYADDQHRWVAEFIPAMERMQRNGYTELVNGPTVVTNL